MDLAEPFSAASHLAAASFWLAVAPFVIGRARRDPHHQVALGVYFAGVGSMFLFSGAYHALGRDHPLGRVLWRLDHGSIWLALAATFTPILVALAPERWYRRQLRGLWSLAVIGCVLEVCLLDRLPLWVSPLLYVGMGWAGFPSLLLVRARLGTAAMLPLLAGGLLGTIGGFMDSAEAPVLLPGAVGPHELMHVCVVAGALCFLRFHAQAGDGRYATVRRRRRELRPASAC